MPKCLNAIAAAIPIVPQPNTTAFSPFFGCPLLAARHPKILFLDEPTVGQDHENLKLMVNSIKTLQKESGFAVVTVTHDIRCKDALSDRKITMKQGQLKR